MPTSGSLQPWLQHTKIRLNCREYAMSDQNDQAFNEGILVDLSVHLKLRPESIALIDRFHDEFGLSSKDATISRILDELLCGDESAMTDS